MAPLLGLVRWLARLFGVVVAGLCWHLVVAVYSLPPLYSFFELASITFIVTAGAALIIAWRWELLGGTLSLIALAGIALLTPWNHLLHTAVLIMTVPGILHILHWLAQDKKRPGTLWGPKGTGAFQVH